MLLDVYIERVWFLDATYHRCVSIAPVETTSSDTGDDNNQELRQWLQFELCWATVMLKSQVQTVEKAIISLKKSEATARPTSLCFSWAKWSVDLFVDPMPFDKLSKIGGNPLFRLRLMKRSALDPTGCEHWSPTGNGEKGVLNCFLVDCV